MSLFLSYHQNFYEYTDITLSSAFKYELDTIILDLNIDLEFPHHYATNINFVSSRKLCQVAASKTSVKVKIIGECNCKNAYLWGVSESFALLTPELWAVSFLVYFNADKKCKLWFKWIWLEKLFLSKAAI